MTTYWAIGKAGDGSQFRVPFESMREARIWVAEQKLPMPRIMMSVTNLSFQAHAVVERDQMQLEG